MPLEMPKQTGASVLTPATGNATVYIESSTGEPSYKDDTGTTHSLKGADGTSSGGLDLPVFDITAYGALVNGSTDDTAAVQAAITAAATAGGGIVYFPKGVTVINGALQDTSGANTQLLLPSVPYVASEQITIWLRGALPPPPIVSVIGSTPTPDNHSVIKGTLNTGAGGNLLAGPSSFSNLFVRMTNLTVRLPSNPVFSAVDFRHVGACDLDNVVIDCGSYNVNGLTQPTTATSFGLRGPGNGNGAYTRLGAVNVIGFYSGYEFAEHSVGQQVAAWGCNRAFVFTSASNHASHFQRLMSVHCPRGIVCGGTHVVDISQFDVEHAASGWGVPVYDIDDASNLLAGRLRWHVVLAGSGPSTTFLVNGATGMQRQKIGVADEGWSGYLGSPTNKTYLLVLKAPHPGRITEVTTKAEAGTCTATVKINTTALGGTANSVSTTEQSQAISSANVFAADDDINLTISSSSSCAGLSFTIKYQRL
jgi:hypothetical protein